MTRLVASCLILHATWVVPVGAQTPAAAPPKAAASAPGGAALTVQQLDALLAPVALYPDTLLMQTLMAATFPIQVVAAARWLKEPGRSDLKGDALTKALEPLDWDPSVKSLIPFPQVLSQLDTNLEWTQQLGYAFMNQQKEVMDSVQRLRRQAVNEGNLQSSPQLSVVMEQPGGTAPVHVTATSGGTSGTTVPSSNTIVIQPTNPEVVYVPSYNPATVYGAWPYPAYPPVAAYPAPYYMPGTALLSGLAFGTGVALTAGLWGWASGNWNSGDVNINTNRWNEINANRNRTASNTWNSGLNRPAGGRQPSTINRPPGGPVGRPGGGRAGGLPANAVGRSSVGVSSGLVDRPRPSSGVGNLQNRPNLSPGSRPGGGPRPNAGAGQRPNAGGAQRQSAGQLPARQGGGQGGGQGGFQRPGGQPSGGFQRSPGAAGGQRPGGGFAGQRPSAGAFGGMQQGNRAGAYGQRGMQSRQGGGGFQRGGGGGGAPRGGGGRGGGGRGGGRR